VDVAARPEAQIRLVVYTVASNRTTVTQVGTCHCLYSYLISLNYTLRQAFDFFVLKFYFVPVYV
jgi:hypothetical protein